MNKAYVIDFLNEFDYPEKDKQAVLEAWQKFSNEKSANDKMNEFIELYKKDIDFDFVAVLGEVRSLSESIGVHPFTGQLLILICFSEQLKEYYRQKNYPLSIWKTCMQDIYYKVVECNLLHGVCGVFVDYWFMGFFKCTRVAFEKLQFELVEMSFDFKNDEIEVKAGDPVLKVHIPRTGGRLEREGQIAAYTAARDFFKEHFGLEETHFICDSWFLFPKMKDFVNPKSNLGMFINDYTIMEVGYFEDFFKWSWRLFDTFEKDIDKLPQETSLQRNYLAYIKEGGKSGRGYGIFKYPPKA